MIVMASGSSLSTELIVAVLGVGGLSAIVGALITGLFSRRKLGSEATEIITKAAAGVVSTLNTELERQTKAMVDMKAEHHKELTAMAAAHAKERQEWQRVLQLHVAWDAIAIAKMGELDIELPPTPPLMPAQRFVDEQGFPL